MASLSLPLYHMLPYLLLLAASGVDAERLRVAKPPAAASGKLAAPALAVCQTGLEPQAADPRQACYSHA